MNRVPETGPGLRDLSGRRGGFPAGGGGPENQPPLSPGGVVSPNTGEQLPRGRAARPAGTEVKRGVDSPIAETPKMPDAARMREQVLSGLGDNPTMHQRLAVTRLLHAIDAAASEGVLDRGESDEPAWQPPVRDPHPLGIDVTPMPEQITHGIYGEIVQGSLTDGDLVNTADIVDRTGRARQTVREGLNKLADMGVLKSTRQGYQINIRNVPVNQPDETGSSASVPEAAVNSPASRRTIPWMVASLPEEVTEQDIRDLEARTDAEPGDVDILLKAGVSYDEVADILAMRTPYRSGLYKDTRPISTKTLVDLWIAAGRDFETVDKAMDIVKEVVQNHLDRAHFKRGVDISDVVSDVAADLRDLREQDVPDDALMSELHARYTTSRNDE